MGGGSKIKAQGNLESTHLSFRIQKKIASSITQLSTQFLILMVKNSFLSFGKANSLYARPGSWKAEGILHRFFAKARPTSPPSASKVCERP
jgi:hypothetical protein